MKTTITAIILFFLTLSFGWGDLPRPVRILSQGDREEVLQKARAVLQVDVEGIAASDEVKDIFFQPLPPAPPPLLDAGDIPGEEFPDGREDAEQRQPPRVELTDEEVLEAVAPDIRPTGVIERRGQRHLMFRERALRVGDTLTVTYRNQDYAVRIIAINRNSFSLRLDTAEIIRPIN